MPKLGDTDRMKTRKIGGSNFSFQGTRIEKLGATEYTLVTIAVDVTGSTAMFAEDLRKMLQVAIKSCQKSSRSDNLLIRVITFSTSVGGVMEIHGFKPLSEINPDDYEEFSPDGLTPLYDAAYSSIGAMIQYGEELIENDFLVNGIVFIITDGYDNSSTTRPGMIKELVAKARQKESLESLVTVLVGINAEDYRRELETFRDEAELDQYLDAGEVTTGKLAKLAAFVSQSVSSQSQALGTGGASQDISATI